MPVPGQTNSRFTAASNCDPSNKLASAGFFHFCDEHSGKHELATEAIKAAPLLAVVGTSFAGAVSWSDVAHAMTALWMLVQTIWSALRVRLWRWKHGKPLDTVKGDK